MNWEEFKITNWDTMSEAEQSAWLVKFVLGIDIQHDGTSFSVGGETITGKPDARRIANCEQGLEGPVRDLYLENCLSEASSIAYSGLTPEQVQTPETAKKFYASLLMLPTAVRARCMYWAVRGERA